MHYRPTVAILNNLEFDHADIFKDLEAIETQFHHLVRTVPQSGRLVVPKANEALQRVLARGCWTPVKYLDAHSGWWASAGKQDSELVLTINGSHSGQTLWTQQGEHNRSNAAAAIAAASFAGVPPQMALDALSRFKGVRRRMECIGSVKGITVFDDFAHHPTAIETTLQGLRSSAPAGRILAVIEPRSNTMKMGVWADALAHSLQSADMTFCYTKGLGWDPAQALSPLAEKAVCFDELQTLVKAICSQAQTGDRIVVMSNGGFGGIHSMLVKTLELRE